MSRLSATLMLHLFPRPYDLDDVNFLPDQAVKADDLVFAIAGLIDEGDMATTLASMTELAVKHFQLRFGSRVGLGSSFSTGVISITLW